MLDFGWQEIMVVAFVLVLVVGPKDMPRALKGFTNFVGKMRGMANEFRKSMLEVADQEEFRDVKKALDETKAGLIEQTKQPISEIKKDMETVAEDVADDINLTETVTSVKDTAASLSNDIKKQPAKAAKSKPSGSKSSKPKSAPSKASASNASASKSSASKSVASKASASKSVASSASRSKPSKISS